MDRKEAIEKVRELLACGALSQEACDAIKRDFPELAESEDEKTLEFMRDHFYNLVKRQDESADTYTRCLIYLDKLKEQGTRPAEREQQAPFPAIKGWVARDKEGDLYVFRERPERTKDAWYGTAVLFICERNNPYFPSPRWEDEPIEVELPIIRK